MFSFFVFFFVSGSGRYLLDAQILGQTDVVKKVAKNQFMEEQGVRKETMWCFAFGFTTK